MLKTVRAIIRSDGSVELLEAVELSGELQALVTILEDEDDSIHTTLLSETSLRADWSRSEEDEAWAHLQSET